ncbi:MFS transporter [Chloroflexus sp.]|uniref:MFS transporter n=1 Tax=Chloroflexus sp. TaxID=1904827 RepID=UPI004049189F
MCMITGTTTELQTLSWFHVAILVWMRWLVSLVFRLVYPLLTFLAAGFAVDLSIASLLITVQVAASLLSPLGGVLSDRFGDRMVILWGGIVFVVGVAVCAVSSSFRLFLSGYAIVGLAVAIGMPALQSYVSARSHYSQRGRLLGVLELSWALSALLGVPLVTWVAERFGLAMVFAGLTIVGTATVGLITLLPNDERTHYAQSGGDTSAEVNPIQIVLKPVILAALSFIFVQMAAVELIFVSYAGWLEHTFGATTIELGLVFGLLGVVELVGSPAATLFTDRIGKRRAVLGGFALVGVWLLLLPQSTSWFTFLILLLAFDLCFEFAIVSTFPLISGLSAQGRGTVLATMTASIGGGRILGSLVAPWLSVSAGYAVNSTLAGILVLCGVGFGIMVMREGRA